MPTFKELVKSAGEKGSQLKEKARIFVRNRVLTESEYRKIKEQKNVRHKQRRKLP